VIVYRAALTKDGLAKLQPETRTLLLLLGHVCNEIMVLQKMLHAIPNNKNKSELSVLVDAGQGFIITRMLCGKLHGAWELIQKRVNSNQTFRDKYQPELSPKGASAYRRLKKHFGKKSPITLIRNNFSFHSYDEHGQIEEVFSYLPNEYPWDFFLTEIDGNTFYFASEMVVTAASLSLLRKSKPDETVDAKKCVKHLNDLTLFVAKLMVIFLSELLTTIIDIEMPDVVAEGVDIGRVPRRSKVSLPFFIDETS